MVIKSILQEEMQSEANIVDLLLSPKENSEVDSLFSELKDLNSVSVALQKEKLDMSTARLLIDETAKSFQNSIQRISISEKTPVL